MSTRAQHRHLYAGSYTRRAKAVTRTAYRNPDTVCMSPKCRGWGNRTLAEHPPTRTGKPDVWSAGHKWAGDPSAPLQPEVRGCNIAERNQRLRGNPHTETF